MVLGTLLSLAAIAAMLAYVSKAKGYSPYGPYDAWRRLTEPLRDANRLLPPVAAVGGWFIGLWLADATGSFWLTFALILFVPGALLWETIRVGIPVSLGVASGLLTGLSADRSPDQENFTLPMRIYESKASDVSKWTSGGVPIPRRSLLTLGASGSGKSETLKWFADDLLHNPTPARTVIYDHKQDYEQFLRQSGRAADMIKVSTSGSDAYWNVFREMETEADADEIARALFAGKEDDSYFQTAGRQLLAANLKYLDRELEEPTNADLKRYFERADAGKMYENLTRDGHEDLTAAAASIDPDAGRQAAGVFSTCQQVVADVFVGDFAKSGSFSMREYMQSDDRRIVVLSREAKQAATAGPIFAHLIDRAITEGMDDASTPFYLFADEFEHMDAQIRRLSEIINVGRGANCQAILSLQSVAQLYDTYSENRGKALLSGMTTSIILRCADSESVDFARSTIGTSFTEYTHRKDTEHLGHGMTITKNRETKLEEEHDFAEGDFYRFDPGECVVTRQGEGYVHGRVRLLQEHGGHSR